MFEISELAEGIRSMRTLWSTMNPLCANREKQSANGLSMEVADDKGDSLEMEGIGVDFARQPQVLRLPVLGCGRS
jgi:hypothetical protein